MLKGILLVATGHPGYGKMAYNLALSIKAVEDIPIAVVHKGAALSHLTDKQKNVFDKIIPLPDEYLEGFGVKLHLDQLTPFDKTLYLDVDMLWLKKKPSDLFEQSGFNTITEGDSDNINHKYYFWADVEEIKKVYGVDKVYQTRSEVIYFEKGCKVFKKMRELKPEKKLKTIKMFGPNIPDELYFNIALAVLKIDLPKWMPSYWSRLNNEVMPNAQKLNNDYYLLSFGSNVASPIMKRSYDNIMNGAANKLKVPYLFKLRSKKEWAPGRIKI